jgi:hypothetical protein
VELCRESADQIVSLSGDSELREWKISVAGECTGSEGLNSSRVVGGLLRKACAKVSEGVRGIQLRRDSSMDNIVEQTPEGFEQESFGAENIFKEEKSTARVRRGESRNTVDR